MCLFEQQRGHARGSGPLYPKNCSCCQRAIREERRCHHLHDYFTRTHTVYPPVDHRGRHRGRTRHRCTELWPETAPQNCDPLAFDLALALICADVVVAEATRLVARGEMSRVTYDASAKPRPYERPDFDHMARTHRPFVPAPNKTCLRLVQPRSCRLCVQSAAQLSVEQAAQAARVARLRGQICGDPNIQGEVIGRISGRWGLRRRKRGAHQNRSQVFRCRPNPPSIGARQQR